MHERARKDAFPTAVPQVNEGATRVVKGIVPAVGVLIFPGGLDPLEDLEEGLEFDLTVRQADVFVALLVALPTTLRLRTFGKES